MRDGRKPRQNGAARTDEALNGSAAVEPESRPPEPVPEPVPEPPKPEQEPEPVPEPESRPPEPEPLGQLALIPLDSAGRPHDDEDVEPDDPEDSDESVDVLVSVSHESLAGSEDVQGGEYEHPEQAGAGGGDGAERGLEPDGRRAQGPPAGGSVLDEPGLEIRLARIHLRTGSLFMARARLEALAAREELDTAAHLDLAEARWRTGDLQGAGEAAAAYLADGGKEALGFVISAEASALAGRHEEARRHRELALQGLATELDPVFAGMPRRVGWPAGAWSASGTEQPMGPPASLEAPAPESEPAPAPEPGPAPATAAPAPEDAGATAEIAAGRSFLESGDPMMAALHFGVAIRLTPASAAAVLEAIGDRRDLPLQLVRGDALRLLGLEADAGNTYLSVASALGTGKAASPEPEPLTELSSEPSALASPPASAPEPAPEAVSEPNPAPRAVDEPPPLRWE